ncbi:MAG: hypothetical protein BWK78_06190 [Thiotrichaceae bacterium IS1]|nr:MAG: hypothetical protein BWK78_06190 [Thiotrichaceae bacterium IS1]
MAQTHERMFYEMMWRLWERKTPYPTPWWIQQYFRKWSDNFDSGLFDSKEAAFCSNASYRYWNMIGVKDHHQESLIGQAGEIEPVYDRYALTFFLFYRKEKKLYFPQNPSNIPNHPSLDQSMEEGYLPVVKTFYRSPVGIDVEEIAFSTVAGNDHKNVVVAQYTATNTTSNVLNDMWFCLAVMPAGPTGFQRRDKAGRYLQDRMISQLSLDPTRKIVKVNTNNGPLFQKPAQFFGLYGNGNSYDPDHYINHNPFQDMAQTGVLNQFDEVNDWIAGLCCGVFAWELNFTTANKLFSLEVKLPVDDYRGNDELNALNNIDGTLLKTQNEAFWKTKLNQSGAQFELPSKVTHLKDLYRVCRAHLLILADDGQIHPGPTIYDDFWIRDSSIEGIAVALAGDTSLAIKQFGTHYPNKFNLNCDWIGPVSSYGFFGGEHEKNDWEWDSNGEALWAIGRFDRINNPANKFGSGMYYPYILLGARWLRDNRSAYGLLHSGWSAEHIGDKDKPHYWDDFWGMAGLYEAAKLAERIGANEVGEIWSAYHSLKQATANSIRWVLSEQARRGYWETFIPTGPGDVGRLDSTVIGILAYFHPCRLYMGSKLGDDIDLAARMTLETIWGHFIDSGGFRHDSAWNCYGPYLTLQLAHAFLLIGDKKRMDICLNWCVEVAYSKISRYPSTESWEVIQGGWNEQHCYPISKDFKEFPAGSWYMGDIPHGWACAEFMMLLRDILFFEADEDGEPHIYIAPGVMPHWFQQDEPIEVSDATTIFGNLFGYKLEHKLSTQSVAIQITQHPTENITYRFPCPFGSRIKSVSLDGKLVVTDSTSMMVFIPAQTKSVSVSYLT